MLGEEEVGEETHTDSDKGKEPMGNDDDARISSLFNILSDLAKGQKLMMNLMGQLDSNSLGGPTKQNQNGERSSKNGEGSHSRTTMQSHPHLYTKTTRNTMPRFLGSDATMKVMQVDQDEPFGTYLEEYRRLGDDF